MRVQPSHCTVWVVARIAAHSCGERSGARIEPNRSHGGQTADLSSSRVPPTRNWLMPCLLRRSFFVCVGSGG